MISISKIKDAAGAATYFRDRDDYYLKDHSPSEWWGKGAAGIGLTGEVDPDTFRDLLAGKVRGEQVYKAGYREVKTRGGKTKKVPWHTPGWDLTLSAPKSVSIAALVYRDERLIAAHDAAVRTTLTALERAIAITRQRDGNGAYAYTHGDGITAALFRHASSRDLDPQLHTHVVIANILRGLANGKYVSLETREGLYRLFLEAETLYKNELAARIRELGYEIDWNIGRGDFPNFELRAITVAERELFSTRTDADIDAELARHGLTREQATRAQRQAASLATRSPKENVPGAELNRRWAERLAKLTDRVRSFVRPEPAERVAPEAAADAAVERAMQSIAERQTRFAERELLIEARMFAQGKANETELAGAVQRAKADGALIPTETLQRVPGGELAMVHGLTTSEGQRVETVMLASVERLNAGDLSMLSSNEAEAAIARAHAASGERMTDEHKRAATGILTSTSHISMLQGVAGSAKTSGVLKVVAKAARDAGWTIEAVAPTSGAVDVLGGEIDAKARTLAAYNLARVEPAPRTLLIVDEAGLAGAVDMQKLLSKVEQSGARVVLVGDTKQIGSVTAGRAFDQIQQADPAHTYRLTKFFRQQNEALRRAVEAVANGDVGAAFSGITVIEHKPAGADEEQRAAARDAAVADVAQRYLASTVEHHNTLVVALAVTDRDAINSAIQNARVDAGEVHDVGDVSVLRPKGWTKAQQADAARYAAGDVILALIDVKHLEQGHTAEVVGTRDGMVTVRNTDGGEEWTFDPKQWKSFITYDAATLAVGVGDKLTFRGKVPAQRIGGDQWRKFLNGDSVTVTGRDAVTRALTVEDAKGRAYMLEAHAPLQAGLGYAATADGAQGKGVDFVTGYARSNQTNLATLQRLYVLISRAKHGATLITDNAKLLAERVAKRTGEKEIALREVEETAGREATTKAPDRGIAGRDVGGADAAPRVDVAASVRAVGADVARVSGRRLTAFTAAGAKAVKDGIRHALHGPDPYRLTAREAAAAAAMALHSHDANHDRWLPPRAAPTSEAWRGMVRRYGVAVAPDGTRYTIDSRDAVHSDRLDRAERRNVARGAWVDPARRTHFRVVGKPGATHVIVSHDHGRTWKRADIVDNLKTRADAARRAKVQRKLELDRVRWQASGGQATRDSEELARGAIASFERRKHAIFKTRVDWDAMAVNHGVEYDKEGRRYTTDGRGRIYSEALTKREWTIEHTRAGRDAERAVQKHAKHHVRYHLARRRLEKVIGNGQQRELDRLHELVLEASDQRWKEAGRHESGNTRGMAREALEAAGKGRFDWDKAALARGVLHDREGRRYTFDDRGRVRSEGMEKAAYHFHHNRAVRAARLRKDRGMQRGPVAWLHTHQARVAIRDSVAAERERLERLAGWGQEREARREQSPTRRAERERQPRGRSR